MAHHTNVSGLTCSTRIWTWRHPEETSGLGIQPNCLHRRYMQKEAKRKQLEEEESPYPADEEDDSNWK